MGVNIICAAVSILHSVSSARAVLHFYCLTKIVEKLIMCLRCQRFVEVGSISLSPD